MDVIAERNMGNALINIKEYTLNGILTFPAPVSDSVGGYDVNQNIYIFPSTVYSQSLYADSTHFLKNSTT